MATHARIGIEDKDGTIYSIYCHNDGYEAYVGWFLYARYSHEGRLRALISLGDISSIGARIGHQINFDMYWGDRSYHDANKNQVVAYHRDRGEPMDICHSKNKAEFALASEDVNYAYLYSNGNWYVRNGGEKSRFCSLEKRLRSSKRVKDYYDYFVKDEENNFDASERKDFKLAYLQLFMNK